MGFLSNSTASWVPISGNDIITCFGGKGSCIYTISSITFLLLWKGDVGLDKVGNEST